MNNNSTIYYRLWVRWSFLLTGIIILAFGITLTIKAKDLGISPWDVLHYGLFLHFGLTVGAWSIITGAVIVFVTSLLTKTLPKIGTLMNMIFIGVLIDVFNWLIPDLEHFWAEMTVLLLGIILSAIGIGIYVAPSLGAGPRDGLMLNISNRLGWKVAHVRTGLELTVFLLGWLLGGPVGIGTVVTVLLLGLLVGCFIPYAEKLMNFMIKRGVGDENINQRPVWINYHD